MELQRPLPPEEMELVFTGAKADTVTRGWAVENSSYFVLLMPVGHPPIKVHPSKPFRTLADEAQAGYLTKVNCATGVGAQSTISPQIWRNSSVRRIDKVVRVTKWKDVLLGE